ncbi:hypothetical protein E2C01_021778 [Portunus trituberculatus]|uniref:Uncharacterized protein n=1 Tax=Portunus trituberculatus TaxID=210409 RepID=A0A5B7E584_PORTR|nr:hypothetical protein [Portunus trituberculatus]
MSRLCPCGVCSSPLFKCLWRVKMRDHWVAWSLNSAGNKSLRLTQGGTSRNHVESLLSSHVTQRKL